MRHLLTPFFYRRAERELQATCEVRKLSDLLFEAYVSLPILENPQMNRLEASAVYSNHHGTGSSRIPILAKYKALSEALERWAVTTCLNDPHLGSVTGMDIEPSSSGFAAFPRPLKRFARTHALNEACERWSLIGFWDGKLAAEPIPSELIRKIGEGICRVTSDEMDGIVLSLPNLGRFATIVWTYGKNHSPAYGFSARQSISDSIEASLIELFRNQFVAQRWTAQFSHSLNAEKATLNLYDERFLYFISIDGQQSFLDKVHFAKLRSKTENDPGKPLVDKAVVGEWSRYAHVWRVLFQNQVDDLNPTRFLF